MHQDTEQQGGIFLGGGAVEGVFSRPFPFPSLPFPSLSPALSWHLRAS